MLDSNLERVETAKKQLQFFDENLQPLDVYEVFEYFEIDKVYGIIAESIEAINLFIKELLENGFEEKYPSTIQKLPYKWIYDTTTGDWCDADEYIKELETTLYKCKKVFIDDDQVTDKINKLNKNIFRVFKSNPKMNKKFNLFH